MLLSIVCVHAVLLAWVAMERMPQAPKRAVASLLVFDVPPAPTEAQPAKAVVVPVAVPSDQPPPVIEIPAVAQRLLVVSLPAPVVAEQAGPVEGGCDLTETVQSAIRQDVAARSALRDLPRDARSVANAVMVWDGHWIEGSSAASRNTVDKIQQVVLATIEGASDDCRNQVQAGPRILSIPGPPDMVLALGSGRWRWIDLQLGEDVTRLSRQTAYGTASRDLAFRN